MTCYLVLSDQSPGEHVFPRLRNMLPPTPQPFENLPSRYIRLPGLQSTRAKKDPSEQLGSSSQLLQQCHLMTLILCNPSNKLERTMVMPWTLHILNGNPVQKSPFLAFVRNITQLMHTCKNKSYHDSFSEAWDKNGIFYLHLVFEDVWSHLKC